MDNAQAISSRDGSQWVRPRAEGLFHRASFDPVSDTDWW